MYTTQELTKEPFACETALLEARADHVHKPPTRAFANTAEPTKPAVKGSQIAEPPRNRTATPAAAKPRTPSRRTGSPQTGRSPGGSYCGTRAGPRAQAKPAHATRTICSPGTVTTSPQRWVDPRALTTSRAGSTLNARARVSRASRKSWFSRTKGGTFGPARVGPSGRTVRSCSSSRT